MLTRFAETEHASLFVDVDLESSLRPFLFEAPCGPEGLDRLGVAIDRSWSLVDGAYVFKRKIESGELRELSSLQQAHKFLRPLGVLDLNDLRLGTLAFSSLSTDQQRALRFVIASSGDGVGDSMLANYPHQIGVRLVLETKLLAKSRTADNRAMLDILSEDVPIPKDAPASLVLEPLGGPEDGELDFGTGELLTLDKISERAKIAFGQEVTYDHRFAGSVYFVSGKFTQRRFVRTLVAVTEPTAVALFDPKDDSKRVLDVQSLKLLVFGPYRSQKVGLGDITVEDALESKSRTFAEAFGKRPPQRVQAFLYKHRLEPTDEFSVSADLALYFAAPGMATLYSAERDALGRPVPYNTPHLVKIVL